MNLFVARKNGTKGFTAGRFYIDGDLTCNTLEDEVREIDGEPVDFWKVKGETAIPRGKYRVLVTYSPHFGKQLPEVLNVPGYVGVRIHPGNTAADTEGCILVGDDEPTSKGFMGHSKAAFDRVFQKVQDAINCGNEVWITVE